MKIKYLLLIIPLIYLTGCTASKNSVDDSSYSNKGIPPGSCRIAGFVLQIDTTLSGNSDSDPCSKSPCTAWIKVEKIIGYGAGTAVLKQGDTLKTKFAFTLMPTTKETFPTLKTELPGLNKGSEFIADFQLMPSNPSNTKKDKTYLVYGYKRIE